MKGWNQRFEKVISLNVEFPGENGGSSVCWLLYIEKNRVHKKQFQIKTGVFRVCLDGLEPKREG